MKNLVKAHYAENTVDLVDGKDGLKFVMRNELWVVLTIKKGLKAPSRSCCIEHLTTLLLLDKQLIMVENYRISFRSSCFRVERKVISSWLYTISIGLLSVFLPSFVLVRKTYCKRRQHCSLLSPQIFGWCWITPEKVIIILCNWTSYTSATPWLGITSHETGEMAILLEKRKKND